MKKNKISSKTM